MARRNSYYLIRLEPAPRRLRILLNQDVDYSWSYSGSNHTLCEISYLQEGIMHDTTENGDVVIPQGAVSCFVDDRIRVRYSNSPVFREVYFNFYTAMPPTPISEEQAAEWFSTRNEAILPDMVTDPTVCQELADLLLPCVALFRKNDVVRGLLLRANMYLCLAILTRYSVNRARARMMKLQQKQPSIYTTRACAYIDAHMGERFRTEDVAAAAGISYSHLKDLFRRDMGTTMTDYINRGKIRLVEQYITTGGMTLTKAAQAVGFSEPKYLSRLFRRYTGMTVQEYRRLHSESGKTFPGPPDPE